LACPRQKRPLLLQTAQHPDLLLLLLLILLHLLPML
jgi:hypothetical protein